MSENSKIEWTITCSIRGKAARRSAPGCDHCYAATRNARFAGGTIDWSPGTPRRHTSPWRKSLAWNTAHEEFFAKHGRRQRIFCTSPVDVFDNAVPNYWLCDLFELIR
jgi:protein gp37